MPNSFYQQFRQLLLNSTVLCSSRGLLAQDSNGNYEIHVENFNPVGNRFPQLCYDFDYGESQDALPSERGTLIVTAWVRRDTSSPKTVSNRIIDEVENIINKRPQQFEDIDTDINEGLRVAQCRRLSRMDGYDDDCECYFSRAIFTIVKDDKFADYTNPDAAKEWPSTL